MTSANGRSNGLAAAGLFGNYARVMAETVDLPGRDALRLDERTPRRAGDATGNGPTLPRISLFNCRSGLPRCL